MISSQHCNNMKNHFTELRTSILNWTFFPSIGIDISNFVLLNVFTLIKKKTILRKNNFSRMPKLDFPFQSASYKPK